MANDDKQEDDQYTYSEEAPSETAYPVKKQINIRESSIKLYERHKRLFIIVGIIILIYIIFKILNAFEHKSKFPTRVIKPVIPAETVKTTLTAPPAPLQTTETENNVLQTQTVLANVNNRLYNIQDSLGNVANTLKRLEDLARQQLNLQHKLQIHRLQQAIIVQPPYVVTAVIPNRAWLLGPQGDTITVSPGSIIPGIGVVTLINPIQGTVITNTGVIIKYSLDDN